MSNVVSEKTPPQKSQWNGSNIVIVEYYTFWGHHDTNHEKSWEQFSTMTVGLPLKNAVCAKIIKKYQKIFDGQPSNPSIIFTFFTFKLGVFVTSDVFLGGTMCFPCFFWHINMCVPSPEKKKQQLVQIWRVFGLGFNSRNSVVSWVDSKGRSTLPMKSLSDLGVKILGFFAECHKKMKQITRTKNRCLNILKYTYNSIYRYKTCKVNIPEFCISYMNSCIYHPISLFLSLRFF